MVTITTGDLFSAPSNFALAHCVSADFALGAGIALEFKTRFATDDELKRTYPVNQTPFAPICRPTVGRLIDDPIIFNLVTKPKYWNKPTLATLEASLLDMKSRAEATNLYQIAMPVIGCGLDKLKWSDVHALLNKLFGDKSSPFEIVIYFLKK